MVQVWWGEATDEPEQLVGLFGGARLLTSRVLQNVLRLARTLAPPKIA
jgi:hypothetical protein